MAEIEDGPIGPEIERRARRIAAQKMALIGDPEGSRLPADIWQQAVPQARREAALLTHSKEERMRITLHRIAKGNITMREARRLAKVALEEV